jgi:FixJ family two-component response regulator
MSVPPALICVVDDDDGVRQALDNLLTSADYIPLCFESGEACLSYARLGDIDFAVVDIKLGGMSGFELQASLNALDLKLPLVFISGHADQAMEQLALRAGAIALLHKPIDVDRLLALIEQTLSGRDGA